MRKYSLMLLLVLMVVALGSVACDSSKNVLDESLTPAGMLEAAMTEMQDLNRVSGDYELAITLNLDSAMVPAEERAAVQMIFGQPITVSGTFAGQDDPVRADLTANIGLSALSIPVAIRAIDDNAWLNVMDQWYEAPEDLQQATQSDEGMNADLIQLLQDADITFASWVPDLMRQSDETIAGDSTVHLSGSVDVGQMVNDALTVMQDPKADEILGTANELGGTDILGAFNLASAKAMIEAMVKSNTIDVWIAKADSSIRKLVVSVEVLLPAEFDTQGLNGVTALVTLNLNPPDTRVSVDAPSSPKPFEELQTDLESNPILGGFLEGFLGGDMDSGGLLGF